LKDIVIKTTNNVKVFQIIGRDQMQSGSVVPFLGLKVLPKWAIHHELVAMHPENIVLYSSVTRFCNEAILGLNSEEASSSSNDDSLHEVNEAILLAFSHEPFSSVRQIARRTCLPRSTAYRRLVDSLHFTIRHLHWVPDKLSDSQKANRVELSIRHQGWGYRFTLDESWFSLSTDQIKGLSGCQMEIKSVIGKSP
jgi:hypothetical protein